MIVFRDLIDGNRNSVHCEFAGPDSVPNPTSSQARFHPRRATVGPGCLICDLGVSDLLGSIHTYIIVN